MEAAREVILERLRAIRDDVSKALEVARAEKKIGTALAAKVRIEAPDESREFLESFGDDLRFLFITSGVEFGSVGDAAFRSEKILSNGWVLKLA